MTFRHVPLTPCSEVLLNPALNQAEHEAANLLRDMETARRRGDRRKQGEIKAALIQKRAECLRISIGASA